ncbi:MAG: DUF4340 domain-containing protein [Acidobacteriota bacterium]
MNKTIVFVVGALALALIAWVTAPTPRTPEALTNLGEPFFPDFDDPNQATSLEVIEFDETTATARPFKVENNGGLWTIPSHFDYPADGEEQLATTAAGVIGIERGEFRSNNVADHEALGVIDPLDENATNLQGRGKRVTLKQGETVLADFIIGNQPADSPGYRFVRIPGQKRVYSAKMDIEVSTRFEDWIEKDLLQVSRNEIAEVVIDDYSIDETTGVLQERDRLTLLNADGTWSLDGMPEGRELDTAKQNDLLGALEDLRIVDVRPKPAGLTATLSRTEAGSITQTDVLSLQTKGFYFTRDGGLVSNEGEVRVATESGIQYILRFGEIVSEALGTSQEDGVDSGENRYLFITADFDPTRTPAPDQPTDRAFESKAEAEWTDADRENSRLADAYQTWEDQANETREKADLLNTRFAGWYYVIPAEAFDKLRVTRGELIAAVDG